MSPRAWWRAHRARLHQLWVVGIACSLLVTGASALGYLEFLQARTLDFLLHVQGQRFPAEVVIVAIDDAAFESLGRRQPLARAYLAQLLQGLRRSGAAVVGLDVALTSPTTLADDANLAQVIREFTQDGRASVVLAETMTPGSGPPAVGHPGARWSAAPRGSQQSERLPQKIHGRGRNAEAPGGDERHCAQRQRTRRHPASGAAHRHLRAAQGGRGRARRATAPGAAARGAGPLGRGDWGGDARRPRKIPRLRYSVPDAEAMYQILIDPAGFKKEHVLLLTDKTEKRATSRTSRRRWGPSWRVRRGRTTRSSSSLRDMGRQRWIRAGSSRMAWRNT